MLDVYLFSGRCSNTKSDDVQTEFKFWRKERIHKFIFKKDKDQYLLTDTLTRKIISKYTNVEFSDFFYLSRNKGQ